MAVLTIGGSVCAVSNALLQPEELDTRSPDRFGVRFETSRGSFVVRVSRDWAPRGADRFYNLVRQGFYDDGRFFRVVPDFVVQFGMHGDPAVSRVWQQARIEDDPVKESNLAGRLTFATAGPNSRTTQVFINLSDNARLDDEGFSPFGEVIEGLDVVRHLYGGYGDHGGPNQGQIAMQGNAYLDASFPELDRLIRATLVAADAPAAAASSE